MGRPAVLVIDKPIGPTSHDVVSLVRRGTGIRKTGHTGTLDPSASGVLVVLLGGATRLAEYLLEADKEYQAVVRFGQSTTTLDATGQITATSPVRFSEEQLREALATFQGETLQVPPAYSAVKVEGRKAYDLARKGEPVELEPRKVQIYRIELRQWSSPEATIRVQCSRGTYLRALARDLGDRLQSYAHLIALRRLRLGPFPVEQAINLNELQNRFAQGDWQELTLPATTILEGWPQVGLSGEQVDAVRRGISVPGKTGASGRAMGVGPGGELVAILEGDPRSQAWQPRKVFTDL
ncbi:MAG: tRNA pseudouridine(55) synthase TruB [Anaerolineales bacterium]